MRRPTTRFRSRTKLLRRPHREPQREVADEDVEVSAYIERELECGRGLFDVLGDSVVWTQVQHDPFLLSRLANDERVRAALVDHQSTGVPPACRPATAPSPMRPGEELR
jgi:hypothetical protein